MSNNVSSFQEDYWIDDLSEIQNELDQTEIEEIEYLCRDYLQGKIIPGSFKLWSIFEKKKKNVQWKFSKVLKNIPNLIAIYIFDELDFVYIVLWIS